LKKCRFPPHALAGRTGAAPRPNSGGAAFSYSLPDVVKWPLRFDVRTFFSRVRGRQAPLCNTAGGCKLPFHHSYGRKQI
jgi:hypothetical protein